MVANTGYFGAIERRIKYTTWYFLIFRQNQAFSRNSTAKSESIIFPKFRNRNIEKSPAIAVERLDSSQEKLTFSYLLPILSIHFATASE